MPLRGLAVPAIALAMSTCKAPAMSDPTADTSTLDVEDDGPPHPDGADIERGTLTEKQGDTSISWRVTPTGEVWGLAMQAGVEVNPADVEGSVEARSMSREAKPVRAHLEVSSGLLHADAGPLDPGMTELRYEVKVKGDAIRGVLHVPAKGTVPLVHGADIAARANLTRGEKGPHDGVLQAAGDSVYEIVGCRDSGEVRAYVLDRELRPIKVGGRRISVALSDTFTELLSLRPAADDDYLSAISSVRANPKKITLEVQHRNHVDDVLVGYEAGAAFPTGPAAPTFPLFAVERCEMLADGGGRDRGPHDEDDGDDEEDLKERGPKHAHGPKHEHDEHEHKGKHKHKH